MAIPYYKMPDGSWAFGSPISLGGIRCVIVAAHTYTGAHFVDTQIKDEDEAWALFRKHAHTMFDPAPIITVTNYLDGKEYKFKVSLEDLCRQILRNIEKEEAQLCRSAGDKI